MKIGVRKLRFKSGIIRDLKSQEFQDLNVIDNKVAHSRSWLKINRVYVPKSFVIGTHTVSSYSSVMQPFKLWFLLITGEEILCQFTYRHYDGFQEAVEIFRRVLPDALILDDRTVFSMISEKGIKRRIKEKSDELLTTEESCLAVIRHNPVDFLTLLAGKKINKKQYYKIDDSDLYFQEFGPDA